VLLPFTRIKSVETYVARWNESLQGGYKGMKNKVVINKLPTNSFNKLVWVSCRGFKSLLVYLNEKQVAQMVEHIPTL
jgi:hypothetical protein